MRAIGLKSLASPDQPGVTGVHAIRPIVGAPIDPWGFDDDLCGIEVQIGVSVDLVLNRILYGKPGFVGPRFVAEILNTIGIPGVIDRREVSELDVGKLYEQVLSNGF